MKTRRRIGGSPMERVIRTGAMVLLWANSAFSQKPLTLQDCLDLAMKNNVLLQVAGLNRIQSETKAAQVKAQAWPSLGVSGLYTHLGKVTSFSIPMGPNGEMETVKFGTPEKVNVDAKLQVPLFTWGRISNTIGLAKTGIRLSDVSKKQEMMNVTDQLLRAFYAVVLNQDVIAVHRTNVRRAENYLHTVEKRFSAGNASKLDLLRAQVQFKNASSALAEAEGNLMKSSIFLSKVVGSRDEVITVEGSMGHTPVTQTETDFVEKAQSTRNELNVLKTQADMNEMGIRIAKSGDKPNLYVFSGFSVQNGFNPMEPEKFVDNWNAGVQLSIPLFDGFATKHKVQEARLELRKTKLQEVEMRDLIRIQVRQALISLHQAEEKINTQEENISLSREALRTAESQYQNGVISSLDLMDAQQTLTQSELLHKQAIFNHIMSKLELCRAIGDYQAFASALDETP